MTQQEESTINGAFGTKEPEAQAEAGKEKKNMAKVFALLEENTPGLPYSRFVTQFDNIKQLNAELESLPCHKLLMVIKGHELKFKTTSKIVLE